MHVSSRLQHIVSDYTVMYTRQRPPFIVLPEAGESSTDDPVSQESFLFLPQPGESSTDDLDGQALGP